MTERLRRKLRYLGINPEWIDYGTSQPLITDPAAVRKAIFDAATMYQNQ